MKFKYLLFIHIPKTGGTFIQDKYNFYQNWKKEKRFNNKYKLKIFENNENFTFGHADINIILKNNIISEDYYSKSFKFCIVRNPYDRFLSIYTYLLRGTLKNKNISFDNFIDLIYKLKDKIPKLSENNTENHPDYYFLNTILNLQKSWIPKEINKIYKFENGFKYILDDIELNVDIKRTNNNILPINKSNKKNKKYYNENNYKKVYDIYEKDFLEFNYSKESYKYF